MRRGEPLQPGAEERLVNVALRRTPDIRQSSGIHLGAPLLVGSSSIQKRNSDGIASNGVEPPGAEAFKKVIEAEKTDLLARRFALDLENADEFTDAHGLAFSGGGIRSATFCLGITQVLARRKLLPQFDYLSTVSGGGYFGSFLSAYLGTGTPECTSAEPNGRRGHLVPELQARMAEGFGVSYPDQVASGEPAPASPTTSTIPAHPNTDSSNRTESRAIRHLRDRSQYLMDGDFLDQVVQVGMVIAGVLFNLLIILPFPLLAALFVWGVQKSGFLGHFNWIASEGSALPPWGAPGTIALGIAMGLLGIIILAYPDFKYLAAKQVRKQNQSEDLQRWTRVFLTFLTLTLASLVLWCQPLAFRLYHALRTINLPNWVDQLFNQVSAEKLFLGTCTLGAAALGYLASRKTTTSGGDRGKAWRIVAFLSGPCLYLLVFFATGYHLMMNSLPGELAAHAWSPWWVAGIAVAMLAWAWGSVDVNTYSPHGYYRDRICECFLQSRRKSQPKDGTNRPTVPELVPRLRLQDLGSCPVAPYHLINTTLNLPNSGHHELRGRNGDFFVFSKRYSGSPLIGYHPTRDLEEVDPHLDLGTAVAVSGAAASSNMGWMTINSLRLIMTLANVRLGYWLRNPAHGTGFSKDSLRPGPSYLFREMFARCMDERQPYLNLSDGGHIENLATYELLRRRCKFIVCVDAGMEPGMECADLIRLERYAAIDLGIKMHYDLSDLILQKSGFSQAYGVLVKIDYAPPSNEAERKARRPEDAQWGWMLYLKLAMVGYGPGYVMDYKRQFPDFPHQSTADQLYDEAQFEAYRALGESAAESFFTSEVIGAEQPQTIRKWFEALASNLLPDNDEAVRPTQSPPQSPRT